MGVETALDERPITLRKPGFHVRLFVAYQETAPVDGYRCYEPTWVLCVIDVGWWINAGEL